MDFVARVLTLARPCRLQMMAFSMSCMVNMLAPFKAFGEKKPVRKYTDVSCGRFRLGSCGRPRYVVTAKQC